MITAPITTQMILRRQLQSYHHAWCLVSAQHGNTKAYPKVSELSRITKYTLTTINTRWEATQRVMTAKLARLTDKIAIQLQLVAESYCSSRSRRSVRKLLDTPSYINTHTNKPAQSFFLFCTLKHTPHNWFTDSKSFRQAVRLLPWGIHRKDPRLYSDSNSRQR
jgi:hypothetical protein